MLFFYKQLPKYQRHLCTKRYYCILMISPPEYIDDCPRKSRFNFGDVLDSIGTLTFGLSKIKAKRLPCYTLLYKPVLLLPIVWGNIKRLLGY